MALLTPNGWSDARLLAPQNMGAPGDAAPPSFLYLLAGVAVGYTVVKLATDSSARRAYNPKRRPRRQKNCCS